MKGWIMAQNYIMQGNHALSCGSARLGLLWLTASGCIWAFPFIAHSCRREGVLPVGRDTVGRAFCVGIDADLYSGCIWMC